MRDVRDYSDEQTLFLPEIPNLIFSDCTTPHYYKSNTFTSFPGGFNKTKSCYLTKLTFLNLILTSMSCASGTLFNIDLSADIIKNCDKI